MTLLLLSLLACRESTEKSPEEEKPVDSGFIDCTVETETCDGLDNDCDGEVDEEGGGSWYSDLDADGYGSGEVTVACEAPMGMVSQDGDCNDADPNSYPGAPAACADADQNCDGFPDNTDADGDGFLGCEECDDTVATTNPSATESCNEVDDNCDGSVDNDAVDATTWYLDGDADGYGRGGDTVACTQPTGFVSSNDDCNDGNNTVHPGADETCDGYDQDCDGSTDEDAIDASSWFPDADSDGYGDDNAPLLSCEAPVGYGEDGGDCNDADAAVNPDADETCDGVDQDCDGLIDNNATDMQLWYDDVDGDGYGDASSSSWSCTAPPSTSADDTDCDDADAAVNPAAIEICNSIDDDCDGRIDQDDPDLANGVPWYIDYDADGYGSPNGVYTTTSCTAPPGYSATADDCEDRDADIHPGATETCDGVDQDCDGTIDNAAIDPDLWYADADGDSYGDAAQTTLACDQPSGYVSRSGDCDDSNAAISPRASEVCNSQDDNCDGSVDEGVGPTDWYLDGDSDGYGDAGIVTNACTAPGGYVADSSDCDDGNASVNPGEVEACNGIDDNCNGQVDDGLSIPTWYTDSDGDGYGDPGSSTVDCTAPAGTVSNRTDCNDADAQINPAAAEVCNGSDDDCDGRSDDADPDVTGTSTWYIDYDADSYGSASYTLDRCVQPGGYVSNLADCDDTDAAVYPGAAELCNGTDDDCDGSTDESDAINQPTWYADADGDSYGDPAASALSCNAPSGTVADNTDCDDGNAAIYPGAQEVFDSIDNDCDGYIDDYWWTGTGADGALNVTGTTNLSTYVSAGRSYADGVSYPVSAISGNTLTTATTANGLAAGDELMILNLHGSDSAHAAVGRYEFVEVDSVVGSSITLVDSVVLSFGQNSNADLSGQSVVVVRVPNYTDVNVGSAGTLTTSAWSGSTGGVLAFRATGTVTVASGGSIAVDELGYAGGSTGTIYGNDAYQGESYAGSGDGNISGTYGYNNYNGAYVNNYGGGGALVTGGGGNYGGGATAGTSWTGGTVPPPAAGATYGTADLGTIFFGSGGGGVWWGNNNPGSGGDGGGLIFVGAASVQATGTDAFSAIGGTTYAWATGTWTYGAGGGAGGSIWLITSAATLGSNSLNATGGFGETTHIRLGGNGGVGRIRVDYETLNGDAFGSAAATTALATAASPDAGHTSDP